jgi:ABC-2 type transport system ATP-binding protein
MIVVQPAGRQSPSPAFEVVDLSYSYGDKPALQHVSFRVYAGRVTMLLGPNGAGKTTLFALIGRLFEARAGKIRIDGEDLSSAGAAALRPLGIVFQQPTLDLDLSVRQNLRYFAALRGLATREADRRIAEELSRLGMAERASERVRVLNGGHRRRVEIARALLHRPRILLLDEPTVGLDVETRSSLVDYLHERAREDDLAVLWATHLIDEVRPQDALIVLHQGRIVADDTAGAIVAAKGAGDLGLAFRRLTEAKVA